ncbi:hypothetical protein ZHAS_00004059 [Anopheles sinensis]|uniref:Uncharacterized protein n=1 Tax=Anopheles sinensis TaxID=74873 RepID=A0A084VFZ7_ANOSI|nr:hypothetical protein ZHAS_00004059 [Anopheles sinensis]
MIPIRQQKANGKIGSDRYGRFHIRREGPGKKGPQRHTTRHEPSGRHFRVAFPLGELGGGGCVCFTGANHLLSASELNERPSDEPAARTPRR